MKLSRIVAAGAAVALVSFSTLAVGSAASAADFYVQDGDFIAEASPYPDQWFAGNVTTPGTMVSTPSGLSFTGDFQILNGDTPTTGLVGLVASAEFNVVSGEMAFQIPIFANGTADTGYTTLVPVDPGNAGLHRLDDGWISTNNILADDGITLLVAGGDSQNGPYYSLQFIEDALNTLAEPYEILAFGAFLPTTKSAVVSHITWNGDTHWFLPVPTATASPTSLTQDDFADSGVTLTFTGYLPGENVTLGWSGPASGGLLGTVIAGPDGTFIYDFVGAAGSTAGNYSVLAEGESSGVEVIVAFAVAANPAELAATGADFSGEAIAGSALLLMGAAMVLATRRRAVTRRH